MGENADVPDSLPERARSVLLAVTGRAGVGDALRWIAEHRSLRSTPLHHLLDALVAAANGGLADADAALRVTVRRALSSAVDTSTDLLETDTIRPPKDYDDALAAIAGFTSTETLVGITADAVAAALRECAHVIEALGQVAGLAWRDLRDRVAARGTTLPRDPGGPWQMSQISAVCAVVDEVVRGVGTARLAGAVSARPLELLLNTTGATGWAAVEELRKGGVSYGTLLAQRDVGGSWGAHRNRTASAVGKLVTTELLTALTAAEVTYWSTAGPKSDRVPTQFLAKHAARVGSVPGQLAVVARGDDGSARLAIFVAVARDGGTARKTGATLLKIPPELTIPGAVVLIGPGWAHRGESDDLVRAFEGRVFTDRTLSELAELAAASKTAGPGAHDGPVDGQEETQ
jgi:hypothetical protein